MPQAHHDLAPDNGAEVEESARRALCARHVIARDLQRGGTWQSPPPEDAKECVPGPQQDLFRGSNCPGHAPRIARRRPRSNHSGVTPGTQGIHMTQNLYYSVLLHVLNMLDGHLDQIVSMADVTAEPANVLRRTKRRRQQAIGMQLLEPPTITAIRFRAARDILDVASIDQGDLKPAGLKNLKERDPVHPGGF